MSINSLLNTSNQALQAFQFAIDLTGANIANVNTPGYSRQRTILQTVGSVEVASAQAQVGIEISGVERIYDSYLSNQVNDQAQLVGYSGTRSDILERVEGVFAENGGGAGEVMSKFWNAWSELAANPKGQIERENLLSAADTLTSKINSLDSSLEGIVRDTASNIATTISEINGYLSQIADLNYRIATSGEAASGNSNVLQDKRADILNKLSSLIDIRSVQSSKGDLNVYLANGKPLVGADSYRPLAFKESTDSIDIVYKDDPDGESLKQTILTGARGKLAAALEMVDVVIPEYRTKLDNVVATLVSEINTQHAAGYDKYGNAGGNFFTPATTAKNFEVDTALAGDVNKIAVSATVNNDGNNALDIAAIKDRLTMNGATATLQDNYSSLVGRIGRDVANAKSSNTQQTAMMEQLINRREATSGVSLDEEMMNLMKYQMSYNSSGKLVSTVTEMMDTLLQLIR